MPVVQSKPARCWPVSGRKGPAPSRGSPPHTRDSASAGSFQTASTPDFSGSHLVTSRNSSPAPPCPTFCLNWNRGASTWISPVGMLPTHPAPRSAGLTPPPAGGILDSGAPLPGEGAVSPPPETGLPETSILLPVGRGTEGPPVGGEVGPLAAGLSEPSRVPPVAGGLRSYSVSSQAGVSGPRRSSETMARRVPSNKTIRITRPVCGSGRARRHAPSPPPLYAPASERPPGIRRPPAILLRLDGTNPRISGRDIAGTA